MENALLVHVVDGLQNLVHVVLHPVFWQVVLPPLYRFVHVHVHQFEHQRQSTRWLIVNYFMQGDDIRMGRQPFQRLDLPQFVHLVYRLEVGLHAFNSHKLVCLNLLRLQYF